VNRLILRNGSTLAISASGSNFFLPPSFTTLEIDGSAAITMANIIQMHIGGFANSTGSLSITASATASTEATFINATGRLAALTWTYTGNTSGSTRINVTSGVTLTCGTLTVNGGAVAPGTYTPASTVTGFAGSGTLVVEA
jgi:hypothetical protein